MAVVDRNGPVANIWTQLADDAPAQFTSDGHRLMQVLKNLQIGRASCRERV